MIGRILIATLFSVATAFASHSKAKNEEWRWTYEYMDACEPHSADWPICVGYIKGFLGSMDHMVGNGRAAKEFCLPKDISSEVVAQAFKELLEHDHFRSLAMKSALTLALAVKFHCRIS